MIPCLSSWTIPPSPLFFYTNKKFLLFLGKNIGEYLGKSIIDIKGKKQMGKPEGKEVSSE
jgi:hypothetical protein